MIRNYSDFLNVVKIYEGGSESRPEIIYWKKQFNEIKNTNWIDIKTIKYSSNKYNIIIKIDNNDKYPYYGVMVDNSKGDDYYMEDAEPFKEKLKNEFYKSPQKYYKNMLKYKPDILKNDIERLEDAEKYNL